MRAVDRRSMRPHCCFGDACVRTACTAAFYIFLGRREIAVRTLLWCNRGFNDDPELTLNRFKTMSN